MMTLLSDPETFASSTQAHRFMVEVASDELDFDGVPLEFEMLDVVVSEPTKQAIELLIAATDWLKGYTIVNFWQPEDGCDCF